MYTILCEPEKLNEEAIKKIDIFNSDKEFNEPLIGNLIYADKLWEIITYHDDICLVLSKLVRYGCHNNG